MDLYIVAGLSALATLVAVSTAIAAMHMQRALQVYELDQDEILDHTVRAIRAQADAIDSLRERAYATDKELDSVYDYARYLAKAVNGNADQLDDIKRELNEAREFAMAITKVTEALVSNIETNKRDQSGVIQDILLTIVDLIASNSLEGALRLDDMSFTAYDLNSNEAVNKIKSKLMTSDLEKIKSVSEEQLNARLEQLYTAEIKDAAEKERQAHKESLFQSMLKHDEDSGNA